jgi:hypothetical protein
MKSFILGLIIALSTAGNLRADTPVAPFAFVAPSWSGMYYFEMIPPQWNAAKDGLLDNGHGVAYQLLRDGSRKELWRTAGWYSGRVFLAEGGVFLVRLEPVIDGHHVSQGDLALAFYKNGVLMKQYSTADLVRNPEKVVSTVSHYYWLASDVQRVRSEGTGGKDLDADAEPRLLLNSTFRIKTCDGLVHVFDVTSGNLK